MRKSRRRIAVWTALAAALVVLGLIGAVGASAHDGQGSDDGAQATETRGHDQEQEPARQEDRAAARAADDDAQDDNGQDGRSVLSAPLAPSVPTDPQIHGVAAGGFSWVLDRGTVRVRADGRIRVEVQGLVIPEEHAAGATTFPAGTARPVTTVSASLYCAPDTTAAVATTDAVPISEDGDATIDTTIAPPSTCLAPIVLVNPNGIAGAYIAVTGWR